jgi:hypothetical protein
MDDQLDGAYRRRWRYQCHDFQQATVVMQAQLDEMKSTGKQIEEMIATNKSLAAATEKAADVAKQTLVAAQRAWVRYAMPVNICGGARDPKSAFFLRRGSAFN